MKLFDPARPLLANELPMYPASRPRAAIPDISIRLFQRESGIEAELGFMLLTSLQGYNCSWFTIDIPVGTGILEFIYDWLDDPEKVMFQLGWSLQEETKPTERRVLDSLEIEL